MDLVEAADFQRRTLTALNRSPNTLRLYRLYQDSFLAFLAEAGLEPTLEALAPELVRQWQAWTRSRSNGRRGGLVTEKQGVVSLKTWAHFLWENDIYAFDPLAKLRVPRVPKIHRKPFTEDEARRLVQAAGGGANPIRDRALLLLMFDTGCRVGELCAASVNDVDLEEGVILFNRTKNGRPREVRFRVPARRDGGPSLIALRQWLKIREARPGVDTLFTTRERRPLSTRRVREIFEQLGNAAHVSNCIPHRARHTAATEFLAARPGAEIQLRSRLGQVSNTVLSDYVSISDPTAADAAAVASLSTRWALGGTADRSSAAPAPRRSAPRMELSDLIAGLNADERGALLRELLRGAA